MSDAARDLLRELLAEALANGNGGQAAVPPPITSPGAAGRLHVDGR